MLLSRNSSNNSETSNVEVFHDEATHQKIRRHLSDKNDMISEEDIKNVKTNFPVADSPVDNAIENVDKSNEKPMEEDADQNSGGPLLTTWNVLSA